MAVVIPLWRSVLLLLPLLHSFADCFSYIEQPIVLDTPRGTILGKRVDLDSANSPYARGKGDVFLGIPYATPPIGDLRFKRPVHLPRYSTGILNATDYGPICPQPKNLFPVSEDCLTLNVVSPITRRNVPYPVMVFIHGGSFDVGYGSMFHYEGLINNLVVHGVVAVTIQYRLGVLGFFTTDSEEFPPNRGILDQIEALRWIQSEISFFGGDPHKVTIFGNSAGAVSVAALTYSPLSNRLFHAAIHHSGALYTAFEGSIGYSGLTQRFAKRLCNFTEDDMANGDFSRLFQCMQHKSPNEWMFMEAGNFRGWRVAIDDLLFPEPLDILVRKRPNIPVIYGLMKDEFAEFLREMNVTHASGDIWAKLLIKQFGDFPKYQVATLMPLLKQYYAPLDLTGNADEDSLPWLKSISNVCTGGLFSGPIAHDAKAYLDNHHKRVFMYEMTIPSTLLGWKRIDGWNAAVHTGDMVYLFGKPRDWEEYMRTNGTLNDLNISRWMGVTWTNFAKTGHPDPLWKPSIPIAGKIPYLEMNTDSRLMKIGYRVKDDYVFNTIVPSIIGQVPYQGIQEP